MKEWYFMVQSGPTDLIVPPSALKQGFTITFNGGASVWKDPRVYLFYAVSLSATILLFHYLIISWLRPKNIVMAEVFSETNSAPAKILQGGWFRIYASQLGGATIVAYMVVRLSGCLTLLGLSIATSAFSGRDIPEDWMQRASILFYTYASLLALLSLLSPEWNITLTRHNVVLLLVPMGVYLYRDLWPLATTDLAPADIDEGWLLWAKFTILSFTTVVVPLFIPRRYIPVDPEHPMDVLNPEQTASIFSLMLYSYLDPIVKMASRVRHLSQSELPPLSDVNRSKYRTEKNFKHLDRFQGAKQRHIFWGLVRIYRSEYFSLTLSTIGMTIFGFIPFIAINRILDYLETAGAKTTIQPWFWILALFLGPMAKNICFQWYYYIVSKMIVRAEGLLTQLAFEYSLRIRVIAKTSNSAAPSGGQDITTVPTPDNSSIAKGKSNQATDASSTTSVETSTSSSKKGKAKENASSETKLSIGESSSVKQGDNLIGKINNLVTVDVESITEGRHLLMLVVGIPLQIICCTVFLYIVLGWSSFIGILSMVVVFPLPGYIVKKVQVVQNIKMKATDARIQIVTESVNVLRMIKLFGWEGEMSKRIEGKRDEELKWIGKGRILKAFNIVLNFVLSAFAMLITFAVYTIVMKQELNASKIFSSIPVFAMIREQLREAFSFASSVTQAKVALDRFNEFLGKTELLDSFSEQGTQQEQYLDSGEDINDIGFQDVTFSWSNDVDDGALTPSRATRAFRLRIEDKLIFKRNCINLIIGPTGSGKTSILMALLGEMHFMPTSATSWFNLPRNGGVAYAAQESWVQNETILNNILFGAPYDEDRYRKTIRQCGLERDLELFDAGDQTEVGERGLTLSGGQKARVTLARAIYSPAEILLLDDVLAALDVHTAKWIVENCFKGDLMQGRTILLVTHNVALVGPLADFIVSIGLDGKVTNQGVDLSRAIRSDPALELAAERDLAALERDKEEIDPSPVINETKKEGKLIIAEDVAEGQVSWNSIKLYLFALGGDNPLLFITIWISSVVFTNFTLTFQDWFLGYWGSQYETHAPSEVQDSKYLAMYTALLLTMISVYTIFYLGYVYGSMRASRVIHRKLISSVLTSTLRWLDKTPTSRILTRCTQDIQSIDGPVAICLYRLSEIFISGSIQLGAVVLFTPIFLIPGVCAAIVGIYLAKIYLKAQLSTKREMSNAKAPVLAHFGAAIHGLVSIRAYGAQVAFRAESLKRIDTYTRVALVSYNLNRWISVRSDLIGSVFTSALAGYLVYYRSVSASNTGFSLTMAVEFCQMILGSVRVFNMFEVEANSLERVQAYIDIEHEPALTESGIPPAAWPTSGSLVVEKLSARYSPNGPKVLHDITFTVKAGERVGVVGRTGSGKSSLTLALLRCIPTEGDVYYDGLPTNKINVDALRSSITIIPQSPELLSGTLRRNLDPLEQHDDSTLNDALRSAGLFSLQSEMDEGRLTLDSSISSGGGNLSVGQRQILALARAIVRKSKLLILDEATSAIDYKTDAIIQSTLRNKLGSDVTVITVAHRLQTIMDADKIMVLDEGRIVEFESPRILLKNERSKLKALVDESEERAALYGMVENKPSTSQ